ELVDACAVDRHRDDACGGGAADAHVAHEAQLADPAPEPRVEDRAQGIEHLRPAHARTRPPERHRGLHLLVRDISTTRIGRISVWATPTPPVSSFRPR